MTTANKDLPALPEPDSTACDYLRGIIKYHSATQVREILRAALARPEPASTPVAVESIVSPEFTRLLIDCCEKRGMLDVGMAAAFSLTSYIDAHVAAQVAAETARCRELWRAASA